MIKIRSQFLTQALFSVSLFAFMVAGNAFSAYAVATNDNTSAPQFGSGSAVRNLLRNGSFESDIGTFWNNNPATRGLSTPTVADAPEGSRVLRISEAAIGAGEFAFTFQSGGSAKPGDIVTFSGWGREVADDSGDQPQLRIEFKNAADGLISDVTAEATSANFTRLTASGIAPAATAAVVFTVRLQGAGAGPTGVSIAEFDGLEATINNSPILLEAGANNDVISPGQLSVVSLRLQNLTTTTVTAAEVVAEPQAGLAIHPSESTLDGNFVSQRNGSVIFEVGNLAPGQNSLFNFPVTLTSGVIPGKSYELLLYSRSGAGATSTPIRVLFRGEYDPIFQEGTVIGKVFNDKNGNEKQDRGEAGVPGVHLVTEEGVGVITDNDGKYHIPAVRPGRHVLKIDAHSLPEGTEFITEESYLFKTTEGILSKVNFAVRLPDSEVPDEFQKDLNVIVTQGLDTSKPNLDVFVDNNVLKLGLDTLEKPAHFKFDINYPDFVKFWYLEIRDQLGQEVWTGFGVGAPPTEVPWSGQTETGVLVKPGIYSYQFKVEDKERHQDWTVKKFLRVISKQSSEYNEDAIIEIPPVGDFNVFRDGKRSIPLVAKPTIRIQGRTRPGNTVTVNGYEATVDAATGDFQTEIYTTPGEKEVLVRSTSPDGETTSFRKEVEVRDSTFFMVALAEEQLGVNFQDGNVQTTGEDDLYKDGFYEDGRLSFYLKGKLKGKFLIESHYDTDHKSDSLFTNLDPDDYYPIYGDASTRDYESQGSLDRFFIVVEMDRSFVKWGSFKTEFNDTELASYNRTVNGLKADFQTLKTNAYGDPMQELKAFWTESRHRGDHNEFAATGGTLYYLRNREVIEGSEKLRVEIRDKIQDITIDAYDLVEGRDYEIDYNEGRIVLNRPLSSIAPSDTLVTVNPLDGNPRFLIVDYEYDAGASAFVNSNRGLRGSTYFGNHFKIGMTGIEEKRQGEDYDLRAVDATLKFGRNTKITAEYATSKQEQVDSALSQNGGLTFANLDPVSSPTARDRENAYLVKAESKPVKNLEVSGYVQAVEPGFSTDRTRSQEGFKKYGLSSKYRFNDYAYARYRFDNSEAVDSLLPAEESGVFIPYETVQTHTFQAAYDDGKYLGEIEYRHQDSSLPEDNLSETLLSELPFDNGIAGKLGYRLNERLLAYARLQVQTRGKNEYWLGGGATYEFSKDLYAYVEQLVGNAGDAVLFGLSRNYNGRGNSYANLRMIDRGLGTKTLSTSVGNSYSYSERSRVYTEREFSTYNGQEGYADLFGYEGKLFERWQVGAGFERRHLDNSKTRALDAQAASDIVRTNTFNTISGSVGYDDKEKVKARTYLEFRYDEDEPELSQWVSRNRVEYQVNQDLSFLGKLDYGRTRFSEPDDTAASFMELNAGFAYRPVDNDKLNILAKYSFTRDLGNDFQFLSPLFSGVETDESAHIISVDLAYDLHRYLTVVEKLAYKNSVLDTSLTDQIRLHNFLWANRFNFHVTRKWDVALEYRLLFQNDAADTLKHGALVEVDREFYDYVRVGMGYNFTDFDDDLRNGNSFDSHGPFVRMTGKF